MSPAIADVKTALTEELTDLHLPTVRRRDEDTARLAERENSATNAIYGSW